MSERERERCGVVGLERERESFTWVICHIYSVFAFSSQFSLSLTPCSATRQKLSSVCVCFTSFIFIFLLFREREKSSFIVLLWKHTEQIDIELHAETFAFIDIDFFCISIVNQTIFFSCSFFCRSLSLCLSQQIIPTCGGRRRWWWWLNETF